MVWCVLVHIQKEQLSVLDEVDQCLLRLRLALPGEKVASHEKAYILQSYEVPDLQLKLDSEQKDSDRDLLKHLRQFFFLSNLQANKDKQKESPCPSTCWTFSAHALCDRTQYWFRFCRHSRAVCLRPLEQEMAFFACAHATCCDCALRLVRDAKKAPTDGRPDRDQHTLVSVTGTVVGKASRVVKCPTCRQLSRLDELSYVNQTQASDLSTFGSDEQAKVAVAPVPAHQSSAMDVDTDSHAASSSTALVTGAAGSSSSSSASSAAPHTSTATAAAAVNPLVPFPSKVSVSGSGRFGSKMEAVVRQLLAIRLQHPGAKAIVFSQWHVVLHIVAQALQHYKVPFLGPPNAAAAGKVRGNKVQ